MESQKYNMLIALFPLSWLIVLFLTMPGWIPNFWGPTVCISKCETLSCYLWLRRKMGIAVSVKLNRTVSSRKTVSFSSRNNLDTFPLQNLSASFCTRHGPAVNPVTKQDIFQKLFLRKVSHLVLEGLRAFSCPSGTLNYFILKSNTLFMKKKKNSSKWPQLILLVETA